MVRPWNTWMKEGLLRERGMAARELRATQLFLLSFAALIAIGTTGFLVLPGLYQGPGLGFVDALFTATSAVCVTGLVVVNTATRFTVAGQAWIALLIQLGGLGILTFATLLIRLIRGRPSLEMEEAAGSHARVFRTLDPMALVKVIAATTLLIEGVAAAILWAAWRGSLGDAGAVWPAVFHAISAFCNAGFSIFPDSLVGVRTAAVPVLTISVLIILGGLGFVVLADLASRYALRRGGRLTTHSRLVLSATGVLLVVAMVLFAAFESNHGLAGLSAADRWLNAWFMAVTPRTAGFNTVDYGALTNASLFLTIILMTVGGSPGSTAGGLKTTTAMLMMLVLWSRLRGRQHTFFQGRTIPVETVQRAGGLVLGTILILVLGIFLLTLLELPSAAAVDRTDFLRLVFEAHSAFGTVGLSMGITPSLSEAGRLVVIALMYVGRVGPLAVVSAMAVAGERRVAYRYAEEDVAIG